MIARVHKLYIMEIQKVMRLKSTYSGPLLLIVLIWLLAVARLTGEDTSGAYDYIAYATPLALNLLGIVMVVIFTASSLASELQTGAVRLVLVRPVLRHELLLAKFLLGMTYVVVLSVLTAINTWCAAAVFSDLSGVTFGGELLQTNGEMLVAYLIGLGLVLLPQAAAVAFALCVAVLTRSNGAAIGAALGVGVVVEVVKHPLHIARFIPTTHLDSPWNVFADRCRALDTGWTPDAYWCVGTSLCLIVVASLLASWAFSRRNLQA